MAKKKKSVMDIELIGGVYVVERFPNGTERREEIDGKVILELLVEIIQKEVDRLLKK
jgi:hypothetical protein